MNERHPSSVEIVQATFRIKDLGSAVAEKEILDSVQQIEGVQSVTVIEGALHVVYDPLLTSEKELEQKIAASGHSPAGGSAERDSPFS